LRADTLCGRGPGFRSWLKNSTNDDQWLWPMCGFESGKFVYIYTAALRKTKSTGPFAFESAGHDFWAKVRLPGLEKIEYLPLPSFRGIGFGNGFVRRGGRIYAFGSKQNGLGADVFVASFPTGSPEAAWKFWDGKTWVRGVWKAEPVARAVSTSVQVCELKGTIVISTSALSLGCDQGKDIFVLTSRSLTGPFSSPRKIYEIPDRREGHSPFFYFPILHSEFINSKKEVLLTYSINNYEPCVPSCSKGRAIPDDYRPRAVRVPLRMILKSKGQP
ncbi:MAG TPA: hypothetical protein VHH88_12150, partial [Verrucomicrobiae bacterium]|nr:hypothetical protein [Verrucomicrobiae bacterium]